MVSASKFIKINEKPVNLFSLVSFSFCFFINIFQVHITMWWITQAFLWCHCETTFHVDKSGNVWILSLLIYQINLFHSRKRGFKLQNRMHLRFFRCKFNSNAHLRIFLFPNLAKESENVSTNVPKHYHWFERLSKTWIEYLNLAEQAMFVYAICIYRIFHNESLIQHDKWA